MSPKNDEVCVDEVVDKTTTESSISLIQIGKSIAKLKAAKSANWPREPASPAFDDKSSSVYLRILIKNLAPLTHTNFDIITLPHPRSMNRSVCYIGTDVESEEKQAEVTKKIRDQGIVGKIKIVPVSLIEMALKDRNKSPLVELAKLYDTYLLDVKCKFVEASLREMLTKYKKFILTVPENFEISWGATAIWNAQSWKDLFVKVGDFGLTDQQLQENIAHVIDSLRHNKFLPNSLSDVELINVKQAKSAGVTIYRNNSKEEVNSLVPAQVVNSLLRARLISDGIARLKVMYDWPKEPVTPVFSNSSESVSLNIGCKNVPTKKRNFFGNITLPHPLSKNRSVCYIGTDLESEEKQAEATKEIRDQGAEGKIKIIPVSLVETVFNSSDHSPLQELAKLYDTILVDHRCKGTGLRLQDFLAPQSRFILEVNENCEIPWGVTALWYKVANNCISVKVGDVGLTDQQLLENLAHVTTSLRGFELLKNGLDDIKYINLACGLEEGIPIYQDNATKISSVLPAKVIADSIAKLKADYPNWPKEAKYNDDASTVLLRFEINEAENCCCRKVHLPHPLSLDRRVCYISSEEPTAECQAKITQKLRDAGVLGTIKVFGKSMIDLVITNKDVEALKKLATLFDTHLLPAKGGSKLLDHWNNTVTKECKPFFELLDWSHNLCYTKPWLNSKQTAGYIKVGYTGLTDEQLQENIELVVRLLLQTKRFRGKGYFGVKSIRLMIGSTEGVIIYKNDSTEVVSKPEIPVQMEESSGVALSDASTTVNSENVPLPKKNGKRKKFTPTPSNNGKNGKDTSPISAKNGDKVTVPETTPQAVTLSAKNAANGKKNTPISAKIGDKVTVPETTPQAVSLSAKKAANGKKNTPISAKNGDKVEKTASVASSMIVPETAPPAEPLSAKKKGAKRKLAAARKEAKKLKAN